MKLRHRLLRWLGVVSPSGAYPLPPRWAMSKLGRDRWYDSDQRKQELAYAADVVASLERKRLTGAWAADVAAGPIQPGALTRFTTGGKAGHVHGGTSQGLCGPGGEAACFDRQPYVSGQQKGPDAC